MKNILSYLYSFSCFVLLAHPLYGVYLEYGDEKDSKIRTITVDFREIVDANENQERINKILGKRAISFTETETIAEKKDGFFIYTRKEKNFFESPDVSKFLKWIEDSQELKSLRFLGVNGNEEVMYVEQALILIAKKRRVVLEVEEFFLINSVECADSLHSLKEPQPLELQDMGSKKKDISQESWVNFKRLSITCTGDKTKEVHQRIEGVLNLHYKDIKDKITAEIGLKNA